MGRRKSIDRDAILDAAETIVLRDGASAMTVATVAAAIGATNGGVQYSFRTKDALIDAMFDRWTTSYDRERAALRDHPDHRDAATAHVAVAYDNREVTDGRGASLLVAALISARHRARARDWYGGVMAEIEAQDCDARNARLGFLAAEGAYLLRMLGLVEMDDEEWEALMSDVRVLLEQTGRPMRSAA